MDQNRPNKTGENRPRESGWSPSSQPGPASGPGSITTGQSGRTDLNRGSIGATSIGSPGRSAEQKSGADRKLEHAGEDIRRGAQDLRNEAVSQGREVMGKVQERVEHAVEDGKTRIADQIDVVGDAIDEAADRMKQDETQAPVGRYAHAAAEQVHSLADYLRSTEPNQMVRGVQRFARNRPEIFLGSALMAGLMIGRFLRSHEPRPDFDRGPHGRGDIDRDFRRDDLSGSAGIGNAAMGGTSAGVSTKPGPTTSGIGSSGSLGGSSTGGLGGSSFGSSSGSQGNTSNKSSFGSPRNDDKSPGGGSSGSI